MELDELLDELGIFYSGTFTEDGSYVIDLDSDVAFGKVFSLLDSSDIIEEQDDTSLITSDNTSINYQYEDEYLINLMGDFDGDIYTLTIVSL